MASTPGSRACWAMHELATACRKPPGGGVTEEPSKDAAETRAVLPDDGEHRAGLDRVTQPGGQPVSWVSPACELQRDWARQETVADVVRIVLTERLLEE